MLAASAPVDMIEEFRLRRWARENYAAADQRQSSWHSLIHEEMQQMEFEQLVPEEPVCIARIVPLADDQQAVHSAHQTATPHSLRIAELESEEMYYN